MGVAEFHGDKSIDQWIEFFGTREIGLRYFYRLNFFPSHENRSLDDAELQSSGVSALIDCIVASAAPLA